MSVKLVPAIEARISLPRLTHNLNLIRQTVGPKVAIMAVVKANAYGHGLLPIARHLHQKGVTFFAVARLEEALSLRETLPRADILILSPILSVNSTIALRKNISLTLTDMSHLKFLNQAAAKQGRSAKIHLKVDTGLNRSGVEPEDVIPFTELIRSLPHLNLEGVFTHFANAEDGFFSQQQLAVFNKTIEKLKANQFLPKFIHAAATGAIFNYPKSHFNLVRPGLGLFGHFPGENKPSLQPTLILSTRISRIHQIQKGETVGYNRTYKVPKNLLAATIMAGYADGLRRAPDSWPYVTIANQVAPIIGRMSMDQAVVDISRLKPHPTLESKVTLLADYPGLQSIETIAAKIGTSPYEVLTSLHERVTRIYIT